VSHCGLTKCQGYAGIAGHTGRLTVVNLGDHRSGAVDAVPCYQLGAIGDPDHIGNEPMACYHCERIASGQGQLTTAWGGAHTAVVSPSSTSGLSPAADRSGIELDDTRAVGQQVAIPATCGLPGYPDIGLSGEPFPSSSFSRSRFPLGMAAARPALFGGGSLGIGKLGVFGWGCWWRCGGRSARGLVGETVRTVHLVPLPVGARR
jgi:hypothetical protein